MMQMTGAAAGRTRVFRVAPLERETAWSLLQRTAASYGMDAGGLLGQWLWGNHRPRHSTGALRADAEVLLDTAGRQPG
jgi:hypothetical protein